MRVKLLRRPANKIGCCSTSSKKCIRIMDIGRDFQSAPNWFKFLLPLQLEKTILRRFSYGRWLKNQRSYKQNTMRVSSPRQQSSKCSRSIDLIYAVTPQQHTVSLNVRLSSGFLSYKPTFYGIKKMTSNQVSKAQLQLSQPTVRLFSRKIIVQ